MSRIGLCSALAALILTVAGGVHAADVLKLRVQPALYTGSDEGRIKTPEGVGFGGNSLLVVADTGNGRLLQYAVAGGAITAGKEIRLPELPHPTRVQVTSKGEILVLDGKLRRIARVAASGEFKGYVELEGGVAPGPVVPRSFKIDKGDNLYVLDVGNGRVLVLGPDGKQQREIRFPEQYGFFSDLAVNGAGTVFLLDSVARRLYAAKKDAAVAVALTESLKEDMDFPTSVAADESGRLFVIDQGGGGVVVLGQDGGFRGRQSAMGWKEGLLRDPADLCLGGGDLLFVADRGNNRVQVFAIAQ